MQPDLFGGFSLAQHERETRLMAVVDAINRVYGCDTLFLAIQGTARAWAMQRRRLSQQFTSRWEEILTI